MASNSFFQEPAHKKDKNRIILNKIKQTGIAEESTYEKQRLKNSRQKPQQTLIPFNFLLHALRKSRTSSPKAVML